MAILAGDIKLLESDILSDVPEGGGGVTGVVIVDNVSNNIFDDISTLDRVYGAVHLRKVFGSIQTQTVDKYYGSHMILSKLPGDTKIGVNLFNTADWFDRRPSAQSRIENYRAQGAKYNGFLWATQYTGSKVITIFQGETAPIPEIGDVLMLLITASGVKQYVRIVRLEEEVQTFTDGSGQFKRRILEIEISDVLTADFVGSEISRLDTITPAALIYQTVVTNAARYYSARPLAENGVLNSLTCKVDSVYSQVVPSSQSEVSLVDISAGGAAVPLIDAATGTTSFSTSVSFTANSFLYLGNPCLPGTLSIPVSGGTLTDVAGNVVIGGSTVVGTINYASGLISFASNSPTYSGSKTVTFRPAAAPSRLADTTSLLVTGANRGYVWTVNITPPPKPGSLTVSYRALNKWYELYDNGAGGLAGQEAGIGSGTVNYTSGSVAITLAALPDANSEIIFSWGKAADFFNRADLSPGAFKIKHTLANTGIDASTLTIAWNDGSARTLTCNAAGTLSGYGTGSINFATGELEFSPTTLPLGGTDFTIAYSYGAKTTKTISSFDVSGSVVTLDLGDTNVEEGSIEIGWNAAWTAPAPAIDGSQPVSGGTIPQRKVDDAAGHLKGLAGSTVNYTTGVVVFDPTVSVSYKEGSFGYDDGDSLRPGEHRLALNGYTTENVQSAVPASFEVHYRTAAAGSSAEETLDLNQIEIDLTPGYDETIVSGSVLFAFGGRTYIDRLGLLYYNVDRQTGAATYAGTIDYSTGTCQLANWASGQANTLTLSALVTTQNFIPVDTAVFRAPVAPVKVGVFTIRAVPMDGGGQITASADNNGDFDTADIQGHIDYETGVARVRFGAWVTAAGNEGEPWYDAENVVEGQIFKPRHVLADTIFYNTVGITYLPLSASILGLDPVRLPADGRVPVFQPGDVVVILHDQVTSDTYTSSSTTDLGRGRIAKLTIKDLGGTALPVEKYSADLDTGIITWGDLSGVSQPLTITDRIEDMAVLTDVQITGTLTLSQPLTHNFPADETLVSNAVIYGTLYARTSTPFDQQTWTNVWSDSLIGSSVAAQYNNTQYPIEVDNASCIQERWAIIFTSSTVFNVVGEHVGQILTGASIASDCAPVNPNTSEPYFTIPLEGWGSGWASGNVLRFNTYAANAPTWIIQAIGQGEAEDDDFNFSLEFRGDIDTP
jgi:hypothetical protein